jgi:hypothetical protein
MLFIGLFVHIFHFRLHYINNAVCSEKIFHTTIYTMCCYSLLLSPANYACGYANYHFILQTASFKECLFDWFLPVDTQNTFCLVHGQAYTCVGDAKV